MKTIRVYVNRTETGKWHIEYEGGFISSGEDLSHLTDVDEALSIAKQVYETRTGERLNLLRFMDMDTESFGATNF
jgi:hypothetical protein